MSSPRPKLALYSSSRCGYCHRVQRAVDELEADVEIVDIERSEARRELVVATGRARVPVLRIEEAGQVRWMPESATIVAYLYESAGRRDLLWRHRATRLLGLVAIACAIALLLTLTRCGGT